MRFHHSDIVFLIFLLSLPKWRTALEIDEDNDANNQGLDAVEGEEQVEEDTVKQATPLTTQEKIALRLYDKAMEVLNDTRPDRRKAFATLVESAKLEHEPSQELVARAYLFGDDLPLNIPEATVLFKKLAAKGNPTAQLVSLVSVMNIVNYSHIFSFCSTSDLCMQLVLVFLPILQSLSSIWHLLHREETPLPELPWDIDTGLVCL